MDPNKLKATRDHPSCGREWACVKNQVYRVNQMRNECKIEQAHIPHTPLMLNIMIFIKSTPR